MGESILTNRELRRYSKHILIPEIGIEGQEKLKSAKVLVVGAGGLGCPVLQYLSATGIGKLSILDFDMVDETNLARQVLYGSSDLGKLKSIIAKSRLEYLNPLCEYSVINRKLDNESAPTLLKDYDVIVDATDSAEARYVINDACLYLNKPMVHGSVYKNEAMVSVFNYNGGPSYRKFNPESAGENSNPAPSEVGLFGVLPGIAGIYMATEVIKILTGTGDVLSGKILVMNIFTNSFTTFFIGGQSEKQEEPEYNDTLATV